jgi:hypothetical protein
MEGGLMDNQTVLHRHPIRGALWGVLMGFGGILLLMVLSIIRLDIPTAIIYTVAGAVVGLLWGLFAPPKKPKGPAPARAASAPAASAPAAAPPAASTPAAPPEVAQEPEPMAGDDAGDS